MTKATMPEPVATVRVGNPITYEHISSWDLDKGIHRLITTNQAEAYAAAKVREALGWQPIATAPKDGFPVLLFARLESATASTRVTGHFSECEWISQIYIGQGKAVLISSHWMPLPPFPQHDN